MVALAHRRRAQARHIGARGRLADTEGLQSQFTLGDRGQPKLLLRLAAVTQQRAHGVHLCVTGGAIAAGSVDLLHDRRSRRQRQAAAAILLRDQCGEESGFGERRDEFAWIATFAIEPPPIFAGKAGTEGAHRRADVGMIFGGLRPRAHDAALISARPLLSATTSRSTTRTRKLTTPSSFQIWVRIVSPGNTGAENRPLIARRRVGS